MGPGQCLKKVVPLRFEPATCKSRNRHAIPQPLRLTVFLMYAVISCASRRYDVLFNDNMLHVRGTIGLSSWDPCSSLPVYRCYAWHHCQSLNRPSSDDTLLCPAQCCIVCRYRSSRWCQASVSSKMRSLGMASVSSKMRSLGMASVSSKMRSLRMASVSSKMRSLGMVIDRWLPFDSHVAAICRACNYHIWALDHIRRCLPLMGAQTLSPILTIVIHFCMVLLNDQLRNCNVFKTNSSCASREA